VEDTNVWQYKDRGIEQKEVSEYENRQLPFWDLYVVGKPAVHEQCDTSGPLRAPGPHLFRQYDSYIWSK
jgi:hypothetical protein